VLPVIFFGSGKELRINRHEPAVTLQEQEQQQTPYEPYQDFLPYGGPA
jgi:hypothetical protein